MKIYVAAMEALRKKERHPKIQFISKIDHFLSFTPLQMYMFFFRFKKKIHLIYDQT